MTVNGKIHEQRESYRQALLEKWGQEGTVRKKESLTGEFQGDVNEVKEAGSHPGVTLEVADVAVWWLLKDGREGKATMLAFEIPSHC